MDRSQMLKLMHKLVKVFNLLNKYFYILPILAFFSKLFSKNNNIFISLNTLIKVIIYLTIIFGVTLIVYFSDTLWLKNIPSVYMDLIEPYLELIKYFWNQLIDYFRNIFSKIDSIQNSNSIISADEIKEGIKTGVKEALSEVIEDLEESVEQSELKSKLFYKQIAFFGSTLFFVYFFIILPNSIDNIDLTQWNWINQSFIEFKLNIKDLIFGIAVDSSNFSTPNTISPVISPSISTISESSNVTITQVLPLKEFVNVAIQTDPTVLETVSNFTQTDLNGMEVGRSVRALAIMADNLPVNTQTNLTKVVDSLVNKITD